MYYVCIQNYNYKMNLLEKKLYFVKNYITIVNKKMVYIKIQNKDIGVEKKTLINLLILAKFKGIILSNKPHS